MRGVFIFFFYDKHLIVILGLSFPVKAEEYSAPIKGKYQCYAPLHCREYRHIGT